MRVEISTGYSAGQQDMPDVPCEGDILHQAEYTYQVAAVVWKPDPDGVNPMFPVVSLLPIDQAPEPSEIIKDLWQGDGVLYTDTGARSWGVPCAGDLLREEDGEYQVDRVEWFLNQHPQYGVPDAPWPGYVRIHLTPTVIADHTGLKAVTDGANAYGRAVVASGVNPM